MSTRKSCKRLPLKYSAALQTGVQTSENLLEKSRLFRKSLLEFAADQRSKIPSFLSIFGIASHKYSNTRCFCASILSLFFCMETSLQSLNIQFNHVDFFPMVPCPICSLDAGGLCYNKNVLKKKRFWR